MILIEPAIGARFGRAVRRRTLTAFLAQAASAVRLRGEISVLLTTDRDIRRLNSEFRKKDKATDVLSFPAPEAVDGSPDMAGDLAISVETAARQADEAGHALHAELEVLLLHGVLHLAGYDHESDDGQMARREAALRRKFGLSAGLIERSAGKTGRVRSRTARSLRAKRAPQGLKPHFFGGRHGTAEAVPLQSTRAPERSATPGIGSRGRGRPS